MFARLAIVIFLVALFIYARVSDEPSIASYAILFFSIGISILLFRNRMERMIDGGLTMDILLYTLMIVGYVMGIYYLRAYTKVRAA